MEIDLLLKNFYFYIKQKSLLYSGKFANYYSINKKNLIKLLKHLNFTEIFNQIEELISIQSYIEKV